MRRRPAFADSMAADDLMRLTQASRRLGGLLDTTTLARRAAREFGELVGTDASGLSIREAPGTLVTRGGWGVRTDEVRDGLRVAVGADSERLIERLVRQEGVHGMLGVPITDRGEVIGVLYGMNRTAGHVGDRARSLALEFAAALGPVLRAAMQTGNAARLSAAAERRRISLDLCRSIGPWLLDISDAARRAGEVAGDADVLADLRTIQAQAAEAAAWIEEALEAGDPAESLPGAIGVDVEGLAGLGDLAADFAVVGEPYELLAEQETVLLAVVRLGLHAVAGRAGASSVFVTLRYSPRRCGVQVEDDGPEPAGDTAEGPAISALRDALARLDGELVVGSGEGGGSLLRGSVPVRPL